MAPRTRLLGIFLLALMAGGVGQACLYNSAAACGLDERGELFTFRIENIGTRELGFDLGCGSSRPIILDTSYGALRTGIQDWDTCSIDCLDLNAGLGQDEGHCTDCGPGVSRTIAPGESTEFEWDRRVFQQTELSSVCGQGAAILECSEGLRVGDDEILTGRLRVCPSPNSSGSCTTSEDFFVPFNFDPRENLLIIEIE